MKSKTSSFPASHGKASALITRSRGGIGSGGDYATNPIAHVNAGRVQIAPWGGRFSGMNRVAGLQYPNAAAFASFPNLGPTPFRESAAKMVNHSGFQIISAGPNANAARNRGCRACWSSRSRWKRCNAC